MEGQHGSAILRCRLLFGGRNSKAKWGQAAQLGPAVGTNGRTSSLPCLFASLLMSGERRRRARTTSSAEPFHRVIIERGRQLSLPARSAVMDGK